MSVSTRVAYEAGKSGKTLLSQLLAACTDKDRQRITEAYCKGTLAAKRDREKQEK